MFHPCKFSTQNSKALITPAFHWSSVPNYFNICFDSLFRRISDPLYIRGSIHRGSNRNKQRGVLLRGAFLEETLITPMIRAI